MPSYKVLSKGFFDGRLYDPEGKRKVLHTEKPFKQVPKWLEAIETTAQVTHACQVGPTVKELKDKLTDLGVEFKGNASKAVLTELLETAETAAQVKQGQIDIDQASFLGEGETSSTVETL